VYTDYLNPRNGARTSLTDRVMAVLPPEWRVVDGPRVRLDVISVGVLVAARVSTRGRRFTRPLDNPSKFLVSSFAWLRGVLTFEKARENARISRSFIIHYGLRFYFLRDRAISRH